MQTLSDIDHPRPEILPGRNDDNTLLFKPLLSGDPNALTAVAKKYYPLVRSIARKFFQKNIVRIPYEDYEDLTQNVMSRLATIIKNYTETDYETTFEAFLSGTVRHVFLDMIKRSSRRKYSNGEHPISLAEHDHHDMLSDCSVSAKKMEIRHALQQFQKNEPQLGELIQNYYLEDTTDPEIGDANALTKIQVWRSRQKALKLLAEFI